MRDPEEQKLFTGVTLSYPFAAQVADGNRGALSLVMRLQHRTHWAEMMKWLALNDYCGDRLWILYKDVFKERFYDMGDFIMYMMDSKHYREQSGNYRDANLGWHMLHDFSTK